MQFRLQSDYKPSGDQPQAIKTLVNGIEKEHKHQVLLGITGSGKTFSMANVVQHLQRPTLVIAHNKTLAAQLYNEFQSFFPENAVEYFVSYYDYYQPEAYVPSRDLYIEKDTALNDDLDRMRLSATRSLLERRDIPPHLPLCSLALCRRSLWDHLSFPGTPELGQKNRQSQELTAKSKAMNRKHHTWTKLQMWTR